MNQKIIVDTCVDFNPEVFGEPEVLARVPFRVLIDGEEFIDKGETVFDKLKSIAFRAGTIRTACPSPNDYTEAMEGAQEALVVTISSELSGSHAAAEVARRMLEAEGEGQPRIEILDCKTAAAGESLITLKVLELIKENLPLSAIAERARAYINSVRTYFVLNSLDTLVSNGRVSPLKDFACKTLKITPIMGEDGNGRIELKAMGRGKKNAFSRLIDMIGESKKNLQETVMAITHVDAYELACEIRDRIQARYGFKDILIFKASGLSSVYASNGGIVLAF